MLSIYQKNSHLEYQGRLTVHGDRMQPFIRPISIKVASASNMATLTSLPLLQE